MDATDVYPENAPLILGYDDASAPVRVYATGYGEGVRLGQVFWVQGSEVDKELSKPFPLLVRYEGGGSSDPLADNVRPAEFLPDLGVQARAGTDADSNAIAQSVEQDLPETRVPGGPSSIHDEQSDKRPPTRRRTFTPKADSAAVARSNDEAFDESFRDPVAEDADAGTYDLDSADAERAVRARRVRSR